MSEVRNRKGKKKLQKKEAPAVRSGQQPGKPKAKAAYWRNYSLWNIWVAGTILKVLLFNTYHSTDFDVHRNWLAITNSLPLNKWYIEKTSQWTLDYPPFFAYFEWALSQLVPNVVKEDGCLDIVPVGQYGMPTVVFQRTTVIVTEILLFAVLQTYINLSENKTLTFIVAASLVLSPGLLIVDHIHFQYNGMLFGILVGVILGARHGHNYLMAALFTILLCFKHIFLYLAPAVFVYLLRVEVLDFKQNKIVKFIRWENLFKLGGIVITIFGVAFGPFVCNGTIVQLFQRLFPFSRGLTHAYWAPNIWAIYSFADKLLVNVLRIPILNKTLSRFVPTPSVADIQLKLNTIGNTGTRGLVQDVFFVILPDIPPRATFLLTLFYDILSVIPILIQPNFKRFIGALTLNGYASFLFGWHVHEKAIMLVIIPFTFLINERRLLRSFLTLAGAGYVSLFPLLPNQNLFKQLYTFIWFIIYSLSFTEVSRHKSSRKRIFLSDRISLVYLVGLIPMVWTVFLIDLFKSKYPILARFEFVGLMIYSVYCGIGVIFSWFGLSWLYFFEESIWDDGDDV